MIGIDLETEIWELWSEILRIFHTDIRNVSWDETYHLFLGLLAAPVDNIIKSKYVARTSNDVEMLKAFFGEEKWEERGGFDGVRWQEFRYRIMAKEKSEEERKEIINHNFNVVMSML